MANYNLGSVQGEIRIGYNGRGTQQARRDVEEYIGDLERLLAELRREQDEQNRSEQSSKKKADAISSIGDKTTKLGGIMSKVGQIPFLIGAAQGVVAFGASLAPIAGLLAVLPAAGAVVASSFIAVKIATSGMGDAFKAVASGDAKQLDEAMKKLAPSAREVVKEYAKLKPQLDSLKIDVQNQFWKDQAAVIGDLAGKYLPTLHAGLTSVAGGAGNLFAGSLINITQNEAAMGSLNAIFGATTDTLNSMGGALGDILVGIINMAGAGSSWIPLWTNGLSDITGRFAAWSGSAAGQQQINTWISQGASVLGDLVKILSNLGSIVGGVFGAMNQAGGGVLQTLKDITGAMAAWVQSAQGQQTLVSLFTLTHQVFVQVMQILGMLVPIIGAVVNWFASLPAPVQAAVAGFLAWSLVIGKVLGLLGPLIGAIIGNWSAIAAGASMLWSIAGVIGNLAMVVIRFAATLAANAIRMAASWLVAMGPIGWIIAAVIALVALIVLNWDWVKAKTIEIWTAVSTWLTGIWNSIVAWATGVWTGFTTWLGGIWQSVVTTWQTVWNAIVAFITPIWTTIQTIITTAWQVIVAIFTFWIAFLLAIFFTLWNPLVAIVTAVWNGITAFLTAVWNGIVTIATTVWNLLVQAITLANQAIMNFVTPIWNAIVGFLTGIWNSIVSFATTTWNLLSSAVTQANQAIMNFIMPIWNSIVSFLTGLWNNIVSFATTAWNMLSSAVSQANNAIFSVISSVWNRVWGFVSGIMSQIGSFIASTWNNIWSTISSFGARIAGIAGQAINWLVQAGKNIVQGLWNGIVSLGGWLYSQIMGWIKSVVPGPILSFLGIASPSKWMRDKVGANIPPGIAEGIQANTTIATAAAATLAKKVAEAAQTAIAPDMTEVAVKFGSVSQDVWDRLIAQGYRGRAGDKAEQIYAPRSAVNQAMLPPALVAAANRPAATGATITTASNTAATSNSNVKTITIGGLTLQVTGNLDPTDPVRWRAALEQIREGITNVEASFR